MNYEADARQRTPIVFDASIVSSDGHKPLAIILLQGYAPYHYPPVIIVYNVFMYFHGLISKINVLRQLAKEV